MRRPLPVNENLHRKNITFSPTYQLIKIVVTGNVKVINKHFNQKSLAYFYPCRFQQSVSKISSLLCPISLPNRIATSGSRESSQRPYKMVRAN
jgi:hypothetical protein